jgi:hypothetical protein
MRGAGVAPTEGRPADDLQHLVGGASIDAHGTAALRLKTGSSASSPENTPIEAPQDRMTSVSARERA